ncbi:hypothetical protein J1605_017497 [Eschrichtius robustus]|uniref:Uncharacterized protein n=1 Tax=Eschrichtius robustus TaxID=9764 RepID=A0AB34I3V9_ESCRO|nr:hypothetical protein J1605_017497 [Eschrichtius robustus]
MTSGGSGDSRLSLDMGKVSVCEDHHVITMELIKNISTAEQPYLFTRHVHFLNFSRAQILESDCLGSYPAATSYELPASVSARVNEDNYDFYSTEVLGGFRESVTKYLQQECRISTISPKETFGIYQAVQTFLEGQWKYNTQFSVAPPSGTCSLLRKRDRIYTFTLTNTAVCTALTASQQVPGRAPPAG